VTSEGASLLAEARGALDGSDAWGGAWQRAAAFLGRQALEAAVGERWDGWADGVEDCSMTAQLVCLPFYMEDAQMARRVRQCWCALSSACHAHPYELAPTVAELRGLLDEVGAFSGVDISTGPEAEG
jgi:hypothetical protein